MKHVYSGGVSHSGGALRSRSGYQGPGAPRGAIWRDAVPVIDDPALAIEDEISSRRVLRVLFCRRRDTERRRRETVERRVGVA